MPLEKLHHLIAAIDASQDRQERIDMLISLADSFKQVPPEVAEPPYDPSHRVPNCESDAYVWVLERGGAARLEMAITNPQGISAMALAAILKRGLNGEPLEALAELDPGIVERIFTAELTPAKNMGLRGMVGLVRQGAAELLGGKRD